MIKIQIIDAENAGVKTEIEDRSLVSLAMEETKKKLNELSLLKEHWFFLGERDKSVCICFLDDDKAEIFSNA